MMAENKTNTHSNSQKSIITDDFMDWEERDHNISLFKHCVAGKLLSFPYYFLQAHVLA